MKHVLLCKKCRAYTMKSACPTCGEKTLSPKPPKYSPQDKYGKYRRIATKEQREKDDLL